MTTSKLGRPLSNNAPPLRRRNVETDAVGHVEPRAVLNIYASVNTLDTRCRLCSQRICPYYTVYQPGESMEFSCFVYGTMVDGSDIWLKSAESVRCYVPRRYVTLTGGASISYCRADGDTGKRSSIPSPPSSIQRAGKNKGSIVARAPAPQVSDPSLSPDPPRQDSCQHSSDNWETMCYNQALACCVQRDPTVDLYWACSSQRSMDGWKAACRDLKTQTNCTMAKQLGNQMEGCAGGDVYRDPGSRRLADLSVSGEVKADA